MTAHFMKEELEAHGQRVITIHYGDAVKWVLRDYFNWDGNKDEHGRHLLQYIGTDVIRKNYPSFWTGIVAGLLSAFSNENLYHKKKINDSVDNNNLSWVFPILHNN